MKVSKLFLFTFCFIIVIQLIGCSNNDTKDTNDNTPAAVVDNKEGNLERQKDNKPIDESTDKGDTSEKDTPNEEDSTSKKESNVQEDKVNEIQNEIETNIANIQGFWGTQNGGNNIYIDIVGIKDNEVKVMFLDDSDLLFFCSAILNEDKFEFRSDNFMEINMELYCIEEGIGLNLESEYLDKELLNIQLKKLDDKKIDIHDLKPHIEAGEEWFPDKELIHLAELGKEIYKYISSEERNEDELSADEREAYDYYMNEAMFPWDTISPGCSWYCGGAPIEVRADTTLAPDNTYNYDSWNVHDGSRLTSWVEGSDGYGIGDGIEILFPFKTPRITKIKIYNGYQASSETYYNNARVKKLKLYINNIEYAILNLEDTSSVQTFEIVPTTTFEESNVVLRFEILDIYEGKKYTDTCISEINFSGKDVHCLAENTQIIMSDGSEKPIQDIKSGDWILGYNMLNGKIEPIQVQNNYMTNHTNFVKYNIGDHYVISTESHVFLNDDMNYASYNPYETQFIYEVKNVGKIEKGSLMPMYEDGGLNTSKVTKIEKIKDEMKAYTLSIPENYCYFSNGFLSINY